MSGIDYKDWLALRQYHDYLNIHTVPNLSRKWWQIWKPKRLPARRSKEEYARDWMKAVDRSIKD